MNKRNREKPLTIKEYTKNYQFPENNKVSKENEYIHKTQNIFLSKILKNRKITIPEDEDINKTIEKVFHTEENRKRILDILKRRNHKVLYNSDRLSLSKTNTRDISNDSLYYKITCKKSFDFTTPIKKYNKINLLTKKNINRAVTPLLNNRNMKNKVINDNSYNHINKEKEKEKEKEKSKNNLGLNLREKKKINNEKENILSNSHLKTESNKKYNHIKNKTYQNNKNKVDNINKNKKIVDKSYIRSSTKNNKKKCILKIEKCVKLFFRNIKMNLSKDYQKEKREDIFIKNIRNIKINLSKDIKEEKCEEIYFKNIRNIKINIPKDLKEEKCEEIYFKNIDKLKINLQKDLEQKKCDEIFLENISNFKINLPNDYKQEKCIEILFEKSENIKNKKSNEYKQEKIGEILINSKKDINSDYSGYILFKKNLGNNEKEIKLDKDIEKMKEIFLDILNEISENKLEYITKEELKSFNEIKQENEIKKEKILEQERLVKENKNSFLVLKNDYDKLILENNKLQEKIISFEAKEKELNDLNIKFLEYKTQKESEIKNLENQIKMFENKLNQIKNKKYTIAEYNIEKTELYFEKKEIDKINLKNINKTDEKRKKEIDEKISKALSRIRKKKASESNNNENIKMSKTFINKSEKISQIAKMLEKQMHEGNEENNNEAGIKKVKTEDKEQSNFLNLIEDKPFNLNKKKPTFKIKFDDE